MTLEYIMVMVFDLSSRMISLLSLLRSKGGESLRLTSWAKALQTLAAVVVEGGELSQLVKLGKASQTFAAAAHLSSKRGTRR